MKLFPEYGSIKDEVYVRITNLPISDSLRDLRQAHLNSLIKVSGVVTRRTGVQPQLKLAKYDCTRCGNVLGPFRVDGEKVRGLVQVTLEPASPRLYRLLSNSSLGSL